MSGRDWPAPQKAGGVASTSGEVPQVALCPPPGQLLRESPSSPGDQVDTQDTTASNAPEGPWSTPFTEEETRPSLQAGSHAAHGGWRCARLALIGQPPQLREVVRPGTWSGAGVAWRGRGGRGRQPGPLRVPEGPASPASSHPAIPSGWGLAPGGSHPGLSLKSARCLGCYYHHPAFPP